MLVGREKTKPKGLHVAVVHKVGQDPDQPTIIRHANKEDGMVSDWTLDRLKEHPRYPVIHGVRRMVPDLYRIHIQPYLER